MLTICETPYFSKICFMYWDEKEYEEFKTFLSLNPNAGDVVMWIYDFRPRL